MLRKFMTGIFLYSLCFSALFVSADDLSEAKDTLLEYEDAYTEAKDTKADLEDQLPALNEQLDALDAQLNEVRDSLDELEMRVRSAVSGQMPRTSLSVHAWAQEVSDQTSDLSDQILEKETELDDLLSQREELQDALDDLTVEISSEDSVVRDYEYLIESEQELVYELTDEAEQESLKEKAAELGETSNSDGEYSIGFQIRYMGLKFKHPCPGYRRYSSGFGPRTAPTAGASTYHKGLDMSAASGTPIYAAESGTVLKASYSSSNGNYVMIDHGSGVQTYYLHASALYVSAGDHVNRGDKIAAVGSTGVSTGPHLHFQVMIDGTAVDPKPYLP